MQRRMAWVGRWVLGIGILLIGLAGGPKAYALITDVPPLRRVLSSEQFIFLAKVEKLDADKPAMVLKVEEDLKGKAPFRKMPVTLKGDKEAEKEKQTPQLLKRLAADLPLVVFASKRGKRYTAFG